MKKLLSLLITTPLAITACGSLPVETPEPIEEIDQVVIPDATEYHEGTAYATVDDEALFYRSTANNLDPSGNRVVVDKSKLSMASSTGNCPNYMDHTSNFYYLATLIYGVENVPTDYYNYDGSSTTLEEEFHEGTSTWTGRCLLPLARSITVEPTTLSSTEAEVGKVKVVLNEDLTIQSIDVDQTVSHGEKSIYQGKHVQDLYGFDIIDEQEYTDLLDNYTDGYHWKYTAEDTDDHFVEVIDLMVAELTELTVTEALALANDISWVAEGIDFNPNSDGYNDVVQRYQYQELIAAAITDAAA